MSIWRAGGLTEWYACLIQATSQDVIVTWWQSEDLNPYQATLYGPPNPRSSYFPLKPRPFWFQSLTEQQCFLQLDTNNNNGIPRCLSGKRMHLPTQETQETRVLSLGWEDPLKQEMETTPVFLPGKSHGEEPGVLQFRGSQRTGHDWSWMHNNNNKKKISSFASGNVDKIDSGRWGIFPYLVMRLVLPRVQNVPYICSSLSISKYILGNDGGHAPPWLSTRLL